MPNMTYISPKAEKRQSRTHGRGLYAKHLMKKGEVVAVKGGYIMTKQEWASIEGSLGPADISISDNLVIGPRTKEEYESSMMHLNHSCEPNVGVEGQIVFVTMRDVQPNEELAMDYTMMDDFDGEMACTCGTASCRKTINGRDWQRPELQKKYDGYFSAFLQKKIALVLALLLTKLSVGASALTERLDKMAKTDQQAILTVSSVFINNSVVLEKILDRVGWPLISIYGPSASKNAFLICQHSDNDRRLQLKCLRLMEQAVKTGDAFYEDVAYLKDRLLTNVGEPQLFGSQGYIEAHGCWKPKLIKDSARVNVRRASYNLGTLEAYSAEMNKDRGGACTNVN